MMIATPKPFASLSSGLLARKGQARPAMRRQATLAEAGDALGWNDMGEPAPLPEPEAQPEMVAVEPPVPTQRESLVSAVPVLTAAKSRKAFTLRLDAERHARLRLAVAGQGRSAQQLVTEALDAFLATVPAGQERARDTAGKTVRSGE
jgi:hypothetical protein